MSGNQQQQQSQQPQIPKHIQEGRERAFQLSQDYGFPLSLAPAAEVSEMTANVKEGQENIERNLQARLLFIIMNNIRRDAMIGKSSTIAHIEEEDPERDPLGFTADYCVEEDQNIVAYLKDLQYGVRFYPRQRSADYFISWDIVPQRITNNRQGGRRSSSSTGQQNRWKGNPKPNRNEKEGSSRRRRPKNRYGDEEEDEE